MNLGRVLALNDLNRNTYNTLVRRIGPLPFMGMEVDEEAGRDKFSAPHALALGVLLALQEKGLGGKIAAEVVGDKRVFLGIWELLEFMATGEPQRRTSGGSPVVPGHWLKVGVSGKPPELAGFALDSDENSAGTRTWLAHADAIYAINLRSVAMALQRREHHLADMNLEG